VRRLVLVLWLVLLLPGCDPEQEPVRMLVVGLDGGDWDVIDPLVKAGYLPTLGGLVRDGARADLDCVPAFPQFACFCPPVWTSLMTGQPFAVHRMGGLYSRADRRPVPALWTLNGARGGVNTLVSVRNSWPFEPEVSWGLSEPGLDAASTELYDRIPAPEAHPALAEPLTLTTPTHLFEILGMLPFGGEKRLAWAPLARDRVAMQAMFGLALLTRLTSKLLGASELVVVTLHSPDKSEHLAWGSVQEVPQGPFDTEALLRQAERWEGPIFGLRFGSVASQYLEADAWLGEILAQHEYDYIVLASDHGMGRTAGVGVLPGQHGLGQPDALLGILSITGPGVRAGVEVEADVLDVAPTLAYLLNLPVAEDLPGHVLVDALTDKWLGTHPIRAVKTW
jgi:hypothetical protein